MPTHHLTSCFLVIVASMFGIQRAAGESLQFNRDIRPILSDYCFACHGPDQSQRKADLRLDQTGGFDAKEIASRIHSDDESEIMPPPTSLKRLSEAQKDVLERWIAEGATYEAHWSFVRPEKPAEGNSIDDFIRRELPKHRLKPSPQADANTLVRRVALDLTGLPPTLDEQQKFAASDSYEAMVDYFLSKPAYGEHMAVAWLDAARYADTNGYQVDRDRELWPWRDWVVNAFNANLPFDQFTIEQLAGDLLPSPTLDQRIATGFHRNHMLNEEGGVIADEFLAEYTADRVETTAAVWLGQTFNCCRCHDHKYDPFTQRDFYAMKAFFHNVPERGVGIYSSHIRTNAPPFVKLPTPELASRLAETNLGLASVDERIKTLREAGFDSWTASVAQATIEWLPLELVSASGGDQPPSINENTVTIGKPAAKENKIQIKTKLPAGKLTALRLECSTTLASASLQFGELTVNHAGKPVKLLAVDAPYAVLVDGAPRTKTSISVTVDTPSQLLIEFETPLESVEAEITIGIEQADAETQWRMFAATTSAELIVSEPILALAKKDASQRTEAESVQLRDYRLSRLAEYRRLSSEIESLKKELAEVELEIPTTLVMEEQPEKRPTFILMRGAYDKPTDEVTAATPAILPKPAEDLPHNRLGLARWLVGPDNPLTARVTVNRFWQQFFGTGLVRSSEDFGSQGDRPSHPELLDWLAITFQQSGWDVKQFVKEILLSETYRQSSRLSMDSSRDIDPSNVWLARAPRLRLPAEVIRDQALSASGLLVSKVGGPTVKPYHPPGLYEQVVTQRDNPLATYKQGHGDELYRRSLYTYWKRSVPHPAMMLFDVPFREVCAMRRTRSNTPLQALNLLNDPTYVEASRFLAQRMIHSGGKDTESRIQYGFRLLLAREPSAQELKILTGAVDRTRLDLNSDPESAQQLVAVGETKADASIAPIELAVFTTLASTLLNLDETITKE